MCDIYYSRYFLFLAKDLSLIILPLVNKSNITVSSVKIPLFRFSPRFYILTSTSYTRPLLPSLVRSLFLVVLLTVSYSFWSLTHLRYPVVFLKLKIGFTLPFDHFIKFVLYRIRIEWKIFYCEIDEIFCLVSTCSHLCFVCFLSNKLVWSGLYYHYTWCLTVVSTSFTWGLFKSSILEVRCDCLKYSFPFFYFFCSIVDLNTETINLFSNIVKRFYTL